MEAVTKTIISSIDKNNDNDFLDKISSLNLNQIMIVDFDAIDKALIKNNKFSIVAKLAYGKSFNRNIYQKLLMDIAKDPVNADFDALLYVARAEESLRKRFLDLLVLRSIDSERVTKFKEVLKLHNLLNDYVLGLKENKLSRVNYHFALYFGYMDEFYPDHFYLAVNIMRSNDYKGILGARVDAMMKLASVTQDREVLEYIEKSLESLVRRDAFEYYEETCKPLGVVTPESEKEEYIEKTMKMCLMKLNRNK